MMTLKRAPLFTFQIEVKAPSIIGATPSYDRRIGEKLPAVVSKESGFEVEYFRVAAIGSRSEPMPRPL
jgi:hypothetical protein